MPDEAHARVLPFPSPSVRTVDQLDAELVDRDRAAWLAQEAERALARLDARRLLAGDISSGEDDR